MIYDISCIYLWNVIYSYIQISQMLKKTNAQTLHPEYLLSSYPELDLSGPDSSGDSPLHLAAYNGHLGIASWQKMTDILPLRKYWNTWKPSQKSFQFLFADMFKLVVKKPLFFIFALVVGWGSTPTMLGAHHSKIMQSDRTDKLILRDVDG